MAWATGVFFRVERRGDPLPSGPVLVVSNHPNSLVDPLVVFRIGGRVSRPMAKAPLFDHALLGPVLRALGGLPVYRRQDDPSQMNKNEGTFDAAVAALRAGEAVQIFPEGKTHSDPALAPIRTGAARIALRAEEEAGWDLGLRIVPVGLTYRRKAVAGGSVVAQTGRPLVPAGLRTLYEADPQEAVRRLTDQIGQALEKLTLNFAETEDRELVEVAERMYAREKGLTAWRARQSLGDRLPRLREFARGLAWLRVHDPERHRRVIDSVRRYAKLLGVLGAGDAEIPRRYRTRKVLWYIVTKGIVLGLTMPVALAGIVLWWIPYHLPRLTVGRLRPAYEAISTMKLATVMLAFPAFLAGYSAVAWWFGGTWWALGVGIGAAICGLVAWWWKLRWDDAREDVRLFLRVLGRRKSRDRLAAERRRLVTEFDELARLRDAETREGGAG